ncbi:DUF6452 family protein [Flavobacterium sp. KACC 22758]|jgi:hypothetical protein|uniref:DUF6452 family protein n=1 Tax=Flavobacterium sp. KACC 22758 TaxID=3025667 RepID=UPI0023665913|nr:DUF6452 family protein [Flavobacterium sp. KACC 22758]WDF61222.1 DUF6452 family protein [Flavobacterium sp. KACC 22758]
MKKIISLLLLFTFGLSSCEKDDICDANTPTTPRLVITFYDNAAPTTLKTVTNLKVVGEGKEDTDAIIFNETGTSVTKYLTNANTISIPLKTDAKTTTYKFIYNATSAAPNIDVLTFNYETQSVYVSRACGFKTTFTLNPRDNTANSGLIRTDPAGDGLWMLNINVVNSNIELENETHVKVYF